MKLNQTISSKLLMATLHPTFILIFTNTLTVIYFAVKKGKFSVYSQVLKVGNLHNYTPGIYADGFLVFVFPFVHSYVRPYFRHVRRICVKDLR